MTRISTYFLKGAICIFIISFFFLTKITAQTNCVPIAQSISQNIFLGCGAPCTSLTLSVPHIKQTSNYAVQSIPYTPYPYTTATGNELTNLYTDDVFSPLLSLPFNFCFYDSSYNSFVVGSNGIITFDPANQAVTTCGNAWKLNFGEPVPFAQATTVPCTSVGESYYPRASIMGAYYDIYPVTLASHPNRKIEYRVEGVAPCRVLIVSYNDCAMFSCNALACTEQIILHEGTGIIEVFIANKPSCPAWNDDLAVLGIQNWYRDKGVGAPGKNDAVWTSVNEGYRFLPIGGPSRYVTSELLLNNVVVATGDTSTVVANELQINFPNVCPSTIVSQYVIRTEFTNCTDPANPLWRYDTVNITKTAALPGSTVATSTTCNGSTGTITVTATGGQAPFTFTLTGPGGPYTPQVSATNTTTFINLPTGVYTIGITDALGCTGTLNETVGNILSITGTFVATPVTCPGLTNGSLVITPGLPAGPYDFTLTGPGGPFTQLGVPLTATFNGLAAGTYSVTFMNAGACGGTINNMVISPGTAPTASISKINASCPGANNGIVTVTPNGGAAQGPYTITLNPGGIVQTGVATSATFTGLAPGTYNATFTNAAGCTGTTSFVTVSNNTSPTATISGGFTSCFGGNDGTVTVTPGGGAAQGPYTMVLNPGGYTLTGVVSVGVFTGIPANTYSCTFTNAAGCSGTTIVTIVASGPPITGTFSSAGTTCPGVNDGTVTINPNGGVAQGPYNYTLNPGAITLTGIPNSVTFSGLAANTYTATFTNALGCTGTVGPVTVSQGAGLAGTAVPQNTSCPTRNDGIITVTPSGTGPFTYTLNPGGIVQVNNPVFTGLAPNTYTITYVTASGCGGTVSPNPVVAAGPYLTSTFTTFDPPCSYANNGTITIVPGGVTPYTFVLTGPGGPYTQATPTFSNLAAGTYNYSFTDGNGCTGTGGPVTLTTHSALATTVTLTQPLCNGNANGVITLNASGGLAAYEYSLSPFSVYQSSGTFNGLAANTYTFRIRDAAGCTKDTTVILGEPTSLTASATSPTTASCSGNDGTIVVNGFGGTPGYTYSIDNGANYQASNSFIAPAVGPYPNIKVKDANGCIANASTTVVLVDAMFLTLGPDTTVCLGASVTMQPQTSAGTSVYNWRPLDPVITLPSTIDNPLIRNATVTPADSATYILNAKWGACTREDTIVVRILHKPVAHTIGGDTAICQNTYAILHGDATNVSGPVTYLWTPSLTVQNPNSPVTIATPASTQTYTLTVTDNYGCNFSVSDLLLVTVQPPVPAYAGNDTIAIKGAPHQLFGSGGVDYLWSPAAPLNISTAQNPLATLYNDQLFVLKVTDIAGCIGYDTVFVQVYEGPNYYVPNAFSPNGDGENDIFRIIPVGIASTEYFRVFNRYGELVFETNQWLKGWNGKFKGKDQPMGVYVWIVKGNDKNGRVVEMRGTVMIVR